MIDNYYEGELEMIRIYHNDKVVAESFGNRYCPQFKLLTDKLEETPYALFGRDTVVGYDRFLNWIRDRVFPEERCGANKLLQEMGLKSYNPIEIAQKTNARLFQDSFSVDWGY